MDRHRLRHGVESATDIVFRVQPDLLVIVDAARMGTEPGSFRRLPIGTNDRVPASTYGLFPSFVLANIESGANEAILIGIASADSSLGKGLSPVVETVDLALKELLRRNDLDEIPKHEFHV
ncbi:hypothetical protein KAR02_09715 [Candidatus Bipolaricaulota bacterium]|nr:hypothetical protein [Candidatus Bipolaricaulota bacterium]